MQERSLLVVGGLYLCLRVSLLSRSGFNLRPAVILQLVKEADVNQYGVIEYEEHSSDASTL